MAVTETQIEVKTVLVLSGIDWELDAEKFVKDATKIKEETGCSLVIALSDGASVQSLDRGQMRELGWVTLDEAREMVERALEDHGKAVAA